VGGGVDRCLVLVEYDEVARRLVARLKYGGVRTGVEWFVVAMAGRVIAAREEPDLVTWVPSAPPNRRRRGFDQGEVLARSLAARLGVPAAALFIRTGRATQTGRSRSGRLAGPPISLLDGGARGAVTVRGADVLVVDDVITTGATLRRAGSLLRAACAARVVGVAAAHATDAGRHRHERVHGA
jgi:competence protein ComFC